MRNNPNVKIAGYSPEEYASFWGCNSAYDPPGHEGDGPLFYNFSSEHQKRDAEYLAKFIKAIEYRISMELRPQHVNLGGRKDAAELQLLLDHVKSLEPEV